MTVTRAMVGAAGRFRVERATGSAQELHDLVWPDPVEPTIWLLEVERPALVLSSTQRDATIDRPWLDRRGIEVARRRSGGGAVLVEPGNGWWVDVVIPRDDPRWHDDVGRSFHWLGRAWVEALAGLGQTAEMHTGALQTGTWGRRVCFTSLGPGEVSVGGAKAVGLSQRRTRAGARFQMTAYQHWHPEPLGALGIDPAVLPAVTSLAVEPEALQVALVDALVTSA